MEKFKRLAKEGWNGSTVEEALFLLDIICVLMFRINGLTFWMWVFIAKAVSDLWASLYLAIVYKNIRNN